MIEIKNLSFKHENSDEKSLNNISLSITKGQCLLLCGESGSGKTSITRLINGLIPHYYEGSLEGEVFVKNINITESELYETAKIVGSVFQNPRSQFFCVDTRSELAFACENMGMEEKEIENRIKKITKEMKIEKLLDRSIFELSGGEKQKIACASVATLFPEVIVLDEPTSNLDESSIEDLKEILLYWKKNGKTIVIAEHRLFWLKEICDRVVCMHKGNIAFDLSMKDFISMPLSQKKKYGLRSIYQEKEEILNKDFSSTEKIIFNNFNFSYDKKIALNIPELIVPKGSIIAISGKNGAGKTTFSRCLCGLEKKFKGTIQIHGKKLKRKDLLKKCYMVMQDVNHQLFCESVIEEIQLGMKEEKNDEINKILRELDLIDFSNRHPMSLSGGQKQRTAIASAIVSNKEIIIFDEPTSGLDFKHMEETAKLISSLKNKKTVFVVTHDPELISRSCTHILKLEKGMVKSFV